MIKTLLIANRGEIARRIMRSAQHMGMRCVAVYSEADAAAPHVLEADEAVLLGPAPAAESYLLADKIIAAAKETGADAIHPGYGFLSENAEFAEACAANNIIFVGPSADSIRAMGPKDQAKKLMEEAGVPVTPGYHGEEQDPQHLKKHAGEIGYPVLIKAVAGGGGKGMRKVDDAKDFLSSLESCQRESTKSFGNDKVLIEKFIINPRHIEVQVFGDSRGRVVHMYERDCSLQRRHQKVIEEAPAPGMTAEVRAAMCSAAINAAKAVDYVGAGTIEFIVDGSGPLRENGFYFMEMNTRLQVEHPVTEMVTGIDLVELQLNVAAGGSVPDQGDISLHGHALEVRLYAEDPSNEFLPSTGLLEQFSLPDAPEFEMRLSQSGNELRVDAAVQPGGEVSVFYDPMIAKVISWSAHGRGEAIDDLVDAIDLECWSYPVRTNAGFLRSALSHPQFRAAKIDTGFIETHGTDLLNDRSANMLKILAAIVTLEAPRAGSHGSAPEDVWNQRSGFRLNAPASLTSRLETIGGAFSVSLMHDEGGRCLAHFDGADIVLDRLEVSADDGGGELTFNLDGEPASAVYSYPSGMPGGILLSFRGEMVLFTRPNPESHTDTAEAGNVIKAPMPGKILAVNVKSGDIVSKGDALIVLEAMKMEHALTAPRDGTIAELSVMAGGQVSEGDILVALLDEETADS
jgi:acetyl/propionyl-CoA carboxylase alpha subunit